MRELYKFHVVYDELKCRRVLGYCEAGEISIDSLYKQGGACIATLSSCIVGSVIETNILNYIGKTSYYCTEHVVEEYVDDV